MDFWSAPALIHREGGRGGTLGWRRGVPLADGTGSAKERPKLPKTQQPALFWGCCGRARRGWRPGGTRSGNVSPWSGFIPPLLRSLLPQNIWFANRACPSPYLWPALFPGRTPPPEERRRSWAEEEAGKEFLHIFVLCFQAVQVFASSSSVE